MDSNASSVRQDGVEFHFLASKEDTILIGSVLARDGEMVLDIPGGNGPYEVVGKAESHWYSAAANTHRNRRFNVDAKWAMAGGTYVGIWNEDGFRYLFSFSLRVQAA